MNELDKLQPEVRDAINRQDRQEKCDGYCPVCEDRATIRAELLRLATIEADALIALDCEHDWQVEHERAERAEAELAALKARIAASMRAYHSSFEFTLDASTLYARATGIPGEETYALVKVED